MELELVGSLGCAPEVCVAAAVVCSPGLGGSVTVLCTPSSEEDAAAFDIEVAESSSLEVVVPSDAVVAVEVAVSVELPMSGNTVPEFAAVEERMVNAFDEEVLEASGNVSLLLPV